MDSSDQRHHSTQRGDDGTAGHPNLCCCYIRAQDGSFQDPCYDSVDHCSYETAPNPKTDKDIP